jgi:ketopantoate reductase
LPDLAVLRSVHREGLVPGGGELLGVGVVECERDGFSAEPVADVVCVAVEEVDTKALIEEVLEVLAEVGIDEVARVLELPRGNGNQLCGWGDHVLQGVYSPVDVRVGGGVVQIHTNGALHVRLVEVRRQVGWGSRVIRWVTDVVGTTAAEAMKVSVVNIPRGNLKEDTYE